MFKKRDADRDQEGAAASRRELREVQREIGTLWGELRKTQEEVRRIGQGLREARKEAERLGKRPRRAQKGQERRDFFISYTKSDVVRAEWIARTLAKHGYKVYLQAWHSPPGESFVTWMDKALAASDNFIAVWSRAYDRSGFCVKERDAAFMAQGRGQISMFLPVRVENIDIGPLFRTFGRVDLFDAKDDAEAERRLLRAIEDGRRGR